MLVGQKLGCKVPFFFFKFVFFGGGAQTVLESLRSGLVLRKLLNPTAVYSDLLFFHWQENNILVNMYFLGI